MKINCITIAQNIQRLMDQKGIDRNKLCEDLGLKYATVSSWLEATKYPRMDKIDMLAEYFEVPRVYLTEQWYTQIQGVPHLFDSKYGAPIYIFDDGKRLKIQKSAPSSRR